MFRIKPHSHQRCSEGSKNPCAHQDPGTPQSLRQNCIWASSVEVRVGGGLLQGQRLWVQQTWVWHKPTWRRFPLTQNRAARTYRLLPGNGISPHPTLFLSLLSPYSSVALLPHIGLLLGWSRHLEFGIVGKRWRISGKILFTGRGSRSQEGRERNSQN